MGAAGIDPQPITPEDEQKIADFEAQIARNNQDGYNHTRLNLKKERGSNNARI